MQRRRLWVISQTVMVITMTGWIGASAGQRAAAPAADPRVQEIIRAITAGDIKRIDDKLVSFGARSLAKYQFPATIEFLAVEGEEQGLVGSGHAAKMAKAAGQNIPAMLNNDIVGGDQTPGHENTFKLRVFSPGISANMTPQQIAE